LVELDFLKGEKRMEFDKQVYFNLLYNDPVAADDYLTAHQTGGMTKRQFAEEYATDVRPTVEQSKVYRTANAWAQKALESGKITEANQMQAGQAIAAVMAEYDMDGLTPANYDKALQIACERGGIGETVRLADGKMVDKQEFLNNADTEDIRSYFENKYPDRVRR